MTDQHTDPVTGDPVDPEAATINPDDPEVQAIDLSSNVLETDDQAVAMAVMAVLEVITRLTQNASPDRLHGIIMNKLTINEQAQLSAGLSALQAVAAMATATTVRKFSAENIGRAEKLLGGLEGLLKRAEALKADEATTVVEE